MHKISYWEIAPAFSWGQMSYSTTVVDVTLNGKLNSNGTLSSNADIDFVDNSRVGKLKFVGASNQSIFGDTLYTESLEVNKANNSKLILESEQVIVEGSFQIVMGVIESEDDLDLIVTGTGGGADDGYVEGNLVGQIQNGPVTFPMGVNNFSNYITLSGNAQGAVVKVSCKVPDPEKLIPTENMVGIADEVEWIITTTGEPFEATATIEFNGIDLANFSNGEFIRAQAYAPSVVKFGNEDTTYVDLGFASITESDNETFGTITASQTFIVSQEPTNLAIALIPILLNPEFYVPNAFAPNAFLEENRTFRPYFAGAPVSRLNMRIWDSLQNTVYKADETADSIDLSEFGWDGILPDGQFADGGVYYYSVIIEAAGVEYKKAGSFLLTD